MSVYGNNYNNNSLANLQAQAPQKVVRAIQAAAEKTGVDFSYLMHKAGTESSFQTNAKAKTSSATGLFQFIDSTWLEMVNKYGDKYGLEKEAAQIDDNLSVSSNAARRSILRLRENPELSSLMAAEYASENKAFLERTVGGEIGNTELYLAHFMGPGGAAAFMNEYRENPVNLAADIFPREARANQGVFYDPSTGKPRTLEQVYAFFDKKFEASQKEYPDLPAENVASASAETDNVQTMTQAAYEPRTVSQKSASLYGRVQTRGNWNTASSRSDNLPNFGTRIMRAATGQENGSSERVASIFPQSLYSPATISPVDVAFIRRLNS